MKTLSKISLGLALILGLSSCGANNNESSQTQPAENNTQTEEASTDPLEGKDTIKVGVVGEHNEVWDDIIERYNSDNSERKIELVKFSEYREPNEALLAGDIDINAFQHYKFLNQFN